MYTIALEILNMNSRDCLKKKTFMQITELQIHLSSSTFCFTFTFMFMFMFMFKFQFCFIYRN